MNDAYLILIITLLAILIGLLAAYAAWRMYDRNQRKVHELELALREHEARAAERQRLLDEANCRQKGHHAYNTKAGLENAMSLHLDALEDINALGARLETELAILNVLRRAPEEYNPDTPKKDL